MVCSARSLGICGKCLFVGDVLFRRTESSWLCSGNGTIVDHAVGHLCQRLRGMRQPHRNPGCGNSRDTETDLSRGALGKRKSCPADPLIFEPLRKHDLENIAVLDIFLGIPYHLAVLFLCHDRSEPPIRRDAVFPAAADYRGGRRCLPSYLGSPTVLRRTVRPGHRLCAGSESQCRCCSSGRMPADSSIYRNRWQSGIWMSSSRHVGQLFLQYRAPCRSRNIR